MIENNSNAVESRFIAIWDEINFHFNIVDTKTGEIVAKDVTANEDLANTMAVEFGKKK